VEGEDRLNGPKPKQDGVRVVNSGTYREIPHDFQGSKEMSRKAYVVDRSRAREFPVNPPGCHILLQEPNHKYGDGLPRSGWYDTIVFNVHDITKPVDGYAHFTDAMALRLADFLTKNEGRPMLVSCDAGLSRSVAVGATLRDRFGYDVTFVCSGDDRFRNVLIYTKLAREFRMRDDEKERREMPPEEDGHW